MNTLNAIKNSVSSSDNRPLRNVVPGREGPLGS